MVDKQFKLWGMMDSIPTARMVVRGIGVEAFLDLCRSELRQRKLGRKYRDATVQWTDILARQGSPWTVWHLLRGNGGGGNLANFVVDLVVDDPGDHIPGLRENLGLQIVMLAVRELEPGVLDFVLSVEQRYQGQSQRTFAAQILEYITQALTAKGLLFDPPHPVKPKHLEDTCPANLTTRMLLSREARTHPDAPRKRGFLPRLGRRQ